MSDQLVSFRTAGNILFGDKAIEQLPAIVDETGAERILVVTDAGLVQSGLVDRLSALLKSFEVSVFRDVDETPSLETVRRCAHRAAGRDLIIGFGGGSAMDAAKAAAVMVTSGRDIVALLGRDTVDGPGLQTILIPTTAGTGSEVTVFAILADKNPEKPELTGIVDKHLLPAWAIVDPTLTLSMPPKLTASTGIDAFSHAVESLLNVRANFQSEPLALAAVTKISENLEKAFSDGRDPKARAEMSAGSLLAGMSLSQTGGGLAHALAETVQIPYGLTHGAAISAVLSVVMAYNLEARPDKYAKVAAAMGLEGAGLDQKALGAEAIERVKDIMARLELPLGLSELKIPEADLPQIADAVFRVAPGLIKVNPRPAAKAEILELLKAAY